MNKASPQPHTLTLDQDLVIAIICAAERGKNAAAISRRYALDPCQVSSILSSRRPTAAGTGSD